MNRLFARRRRSEQGSALILALVFAVLFSTLVATVITLADVGLKSAKGYRVNREASVGPEAAMQAAILQRAQGVECDDRGYVVPNTPAGDPVGGTDLSVLCQSLAPESASGGTSTRPRTSLLALGDHADEGIITGSGMKLRGDVFSTSQVSAGARLDVEGRVSALTACSGEVVTAPNPPPSCGSPPADPVEGRDPDFTKATTVVPVRRTIVPATLCSGPGWLVSLEPGYYDNADDLSDLTVDGGACDSKVIWMKSGTYYFDFGFDSPEPTPNFVWEVTDPDVTVVAGEPTFDTLSPTPPTIDVPGSCIGPGDEDHNDGVEIIVGGRSQIDIQDGRMELCAPLRATEQQISLYGVPERKFVHTLEPTAIGTDTTGFANPSRAFTPGELTHSTSDATLTPASPGPARLTLGTFRQTIPTGSFIDAARLRVVHEETGDVGVITLEADDCAGVTTLTEQSSLALQEFDLKATCGFDTPEELADLSVTYTVNESVGGTATARIDAIVVDVEYREPITRKPTATVGVAGFAPVQAAFEIGERPEALATANLTSGSPTASIAFTGFADPPLPPGAQIDSAVLRVRHEDGVDITGAITTSLSACAGFPSFDNQPVLITESLPLDLDLCLNTAEDLAGLEVTYTATLGGALADADALLDGVWLELTYRPVVTATAATATSTGASGFTALDDGRVIDGAPATANVSSTANVALALTAWPGMIPEDSLLDSVELLVAHQTDPATGLGGTIAAAVTPSFGGANSCAGGIPLDSTPIIATQVLNLKACGLDELDDLGDLGDLSDFSAEYEAVVTGSGSDDVLVDGMTLRLVYRPPATFSETTPTTVRHPTEVGPPAPEAFPGGTADNALEVDGVTTDADLGVTVTPLFNVTTAALTLRGYDSPALPAGSVVGSAMLKVTHSDVITQDDNNAAVTPKVFANFAGTTCPTGLALPSSAGLTTTTLNLLADCGLNTPEEFAGFAARYEATFTGEGTATVRLDGMVLEIVFTPPSMRPLSGCHDQEPYPTNGASCALVKSAIGSTATIPARFVANGTVYAPSAVVDLAMNDVEAGVLTRGVVARHIRLDLKALTGSDAPTVGVPPDSVVFTVYPHDTRRGTAASTDFGSPADAQEIDDTNATATVPPAPPESVGYATTVEPPPSGFAPDSDGLAVDGTPAIATLSDPGNPSASITVGTFNIPTIPTDAVIDEAKLRVVHREDAGIDATITPLACSPGPVDLPEIPGPLGEAIVDLISDCGIDSPAALNALTATFDAALVPPTAGGTAELDGVELRVKYRVPVSITFDAFPTDPALTSIDAAILRIAHPNALGVVDPEGISVSVAFTATETPRTCMDPIRVSPGENASIDLTSACRLDDVDELADLTITYSVLVAPDGPGGVATLDGIELEIFSGPLLRAEVAFERGRADIEGWSVLS